MKKWEYKVEPKLWSELMASKWMQTLGEDRWELVSVKELEKAFMWLCFFKRELILGKEFQYSEDDEN